MNITKNLPRFEKEKALLLVAGMKEVRFYTANNAKINAHGAFRMETPHQIVDHDGALETGSNGLGTTIEPKKQRERNGFYHQLNEQLESLEHEDLESVYMFAPQNIQTEVKNHLPPNLRDKLKYAFVGNYTHSHPFRLLKIINNREEENRAKDVKPISQEASTIYKKSEQAKKSVRKRTY